jgi:hypothetical protein
MDKIIERRKEIDVVKIHEYVMDSVMINPNNKNIFYWVLIKDYILKYRLFPKKQILAEIKKHELVFFKKKT